MRRLFPLRRRSASSSSITSRGGNCGSSRGTAPSACSCRERARARTAARRWRSSCAACARTRIGGVPEGPRLLSATLATGTPSRARTIVVTLPPRGGPVANDKRYYIAVLGGGFHGLLVSKTTSIPGLVSIVDIAPTALGHQRGSLTSMPSRHAIGSLEKPQRADPREQPVEARGAHRARVLRTAPYVRPPARGADRGSRRAAREHRPRRRACDERGRDPRRAHRRNCRRRTVARTRVPHATGGCCCSSSPCSGCTSICSRCTRVGRVDAARADAELALLGNRQPARDAAARTAPRRRGDRGAQVRRARLCGVRRARPVHDDRQPLRLRRRRSDRARRRARVPRCAHPASRRARLHLAARHRSRRRAEGRVGESQHGGPRPPAQRVRERAVGV